MKSHLGQERDDGFILVAGGGVEIEEQPGVSRSRTGNTLRIITWNVRHFKGDDGVVDPLRAANAIKHTTPDLVALQEVFHPFSQDGRVWHPLRDFGNELGMGLAFAKNEELTTKAAGGEYGNALLKRGPYDGATNYLLTRSPAPPREFNEQRGMLSIRFDLGLRQFFVYNSHLDPEQGHDLQVAQVRELLTHIKLWNSPHVLVGDFNSLAPDAAGAEPERARVVQTILSAGYVDAGWFRGQCTFPSQAPTQRLDYIFVQPGVVISKCEVIENDLARAASDHLPLYAELAL